MSLGTHADHRWFPPAHNPYGYVPIPLLAVSHEYQNRLTTCSRHSDSVIHRGDFMNKTKRMKKMNTAPVKRRCQYVGYPDQNYDRCILITRICPLEREDY